MSEARDERKELISLRGCSRCSLNGICRKVRAASSDHFRWSIHNLLAHPLSEIAWIFGFRKASDWLHDKSIPMELEEANIDERNAE